MNSENVKNKLGKYENMKEKGKKPGKKIMEGTEKVMKKVEIREAYG